MMKGIDHIAILAKDPEELLEWYQNVFGFEVVLGSFLKLPDNTMLEILKAGEDGGILGKDVSGIRHIAFRVDDFDAMVDLIREQNVEIIVEPTVGPRNKAFFFRDPEGNILQFQHWIEPPY